MARTPLTEAEASGIMQASKTVIQDIDWERKPNEGWFKSEVEVKNRLRLNLKLRLNINAKDYNLYSFTLILNNAFPIARLDAKGSHKNRHTDSNDWKGKTHKHKWTNLCRDGWAYSPSDIDERTIESSFISFCGECGINFEGQFNKIPPRQVSLLGLNK